MAKGERKQICILFLFCFCFLVCFLFFDGCCNCCLLCCHTHKKLEICFPVAHVFCISLYPVADMMFTFLQHAAFLGCWKVNAFQALETENDFEKSCQQTTPLKTNRLCFPWSSCDSKLKTQPQNENQFHTLWHPQAHTTLFTSPFISCATYNKEP